MKKIILLIISLFCFCACVNGDKTSNERICVEKITYQEHDYLIFSSANGHYIGVEHDMNCWCMIDYD